MRHPLAFLLIGLFFGAGLGALWAGSQGLTFDGHNHASDHGTGDHKSTAHTPVDLPAGPSAPTLAITLHPDAVSGLNLEIQTTNFTFSPASVNQPNSPNTGHAHIYANGKKLARIYAPWFHIAGLPAGEHQITVELNANTHGVLRVANTPLRITQTVIIP